MDGDVRRAADELRRARLRAGLTLDVVATAIGVSAATVLRTERAIGRSPRPDLLAVHAATVGMRARLLVFPDGEPLRDAPQIRLLRDFRDAIGGGLPIEIERPVIPVPGTGDARAFDAVIRLGEADCAVECYTRLDDCQAQVRAALLKQRDAGVARLVIVLRATRGNRAAVRSTAGLIESAFPLGTREVLGALRAGRDPAANGLVFI